MSSLVGGPSMVGGLGPRAPWAPPISGPATLSELAIIGHWVGCSIAVPRLGWPAASVCLYVCPERKMAWAINTEVGGDVGLGQWQTLAVLRK